MLYNSNFVGSDVLDYLCPKVEAWRVKAAGLDNVGQVALLGDGRRLQQSPCNYRCDVKCRVPFMLPSMCFSSWVVAWSEEGAEMDEMFGSTVKYTGSDQ